MIDLRLGDCLDVLKTLEANSVDAVVTDPPYGLGFAYDGYEDTRDNLKRLVDRFMPEARRVARRVYVLCGITQVHLYPEPDWILCVTWNTTGSFGKYGYTQWMPVLAYGPDVKGFGRVNGVLKGDTLRISGGSGVGFMRSGEKANHPCPKPLNVMTELLRRITMTDELILDPFAGSGTTLVAAISTGRRCIGIEQSPAYHAIATRRIEAEQAKTALFPVTNESDADSIRPA